MEVCKLASLVAEAPGGFSLASGYISSKNAGLKLRVLSRLSTPVLCALCLQAMEVHLDALGYDKAAQFQF